MKISSWSAALAMSLALAACGGGGGGAGTPVFGTAAPAPASTASSTTGAASAASAVATRVDVLASAIQVGSGGDTVTVTATVTGTGNVTLPATPVTFSADSGLLAVASPATTDAAGSLTATFTAGADKSNRLVTITATSGTVSGTIALQVTGTSITGPGSSVIALGASVPVAVKIVDSKGLPVANVPIAVTSTLGNTLSAASVNSDAQGTASITYTAAKAGSDTVSYKGGGVTVTQSIAISGENFTFSSPAPGTTVPVGTSQPLRVQYLSGGVPQANKVINFASTGGQLQPTSALTDASGVASTSISATTANVATVQATVAGNLAQATLPITFVGGTPTQIILQASPTAIGPNLSGATTQQASVLAKVIDANNNPVQGQTVAFNRTADPSGGNLTQATAITDSSGQASVNYIAGPLSTPSNGVALNASLVSNPAVIGTAAITVNQSALFIALGTGNDISNLDPQTYNKDYVVSVTDVNGIAVPGVSLTIKVLPVSYGKGSLTFVGTSWTRTSGSTGNSVECQNEDRAYTGVLDPAFDANHNGTLEPGNVISVTPGSVTTDANGRATISLRYAESYSPWVTVTLRAQATVAGTESSKETTFTVPALASDVNSASTTPAGVNSPFGTALDCTNPN